MNTTLQFTQNNPAAATTTITAPTPDVEKQAKLQSPPPAPQTPYQRVAMAILAALLIASLAGNYIYSGRANEYKLASEQETLKADSLLSVKLLIEKQLADSKALVNQVNTDNQSLNTQLAEAKEQIVIKETEVTKLVKEKASLEAFKKQLASVQALNVRLQAQLAAAQAENSTLRAEVNTLRQNLASLQASERNLQQKIENASGLQAYSFRVEAKDKRWRGKLANTTKARRTDRLEVAFELAENKLAPAGPREVHLVITSPVGEVLQGAHSGKTTLNGKESSYTDASTLTYKQTAYPLSFQWDAAGKLQAGIYKVQAYCGGSLVGQSEITLK